MKLQHKKQAQCYLVSNEGRDFYLLIGFIYYLERFQNYEVSLEFVWDAQKIRTGNPDLVLLPNSRGHHLYYEIAKYCYDNEIPLFIHDSEGNFNTEIIYDFWSYNLDKKTFCPKMFTWNQRVKNYLVSKYQLPKEEVCVTGAPGIDKYRYSSLEEHSELLAKYGKSHYKTVVGYAGWAFGKLQNKEINDLLHHLNYKGDREAEGIQWIENQRILVESYLRSAIEKYPDTLFILKKHPRENFESDNRDSLNEMNRLTKYENVLYLKDEENIQDLIQISDLWMAFESTSIMEAWLLNIPTLMINPDPDFTRSPIYKGSFLVKTDEELLAAIEQVLMLKNIAAVNPEHVVAERKRIIEDAFGFDDGLNHLRCAFYFNPYLISEPKIKKNPKLKLKFLRYYLLLHIGKLFYIPWLFKRLPKFKKTVWIFENYKLSKVKALKKSVFKDLDEFYERNNLPERIRSGEIWSEL